MFWLELLSFVILLTAVIRNWFLIWAPHIELWDNSVHQLRFPKKKKNQVKPCWHADILDFLTFDSSQCERFANWKAKKKQMKWIAA